MTKTAEHDMEVAEAAARRREAQLGRRASLLNSVREHGRPTQNFTPADKEREKKKHNGS